MLPAVRSGARFFPSQTFRRHARTCRLLITAVVRSIYLIDAIQLRLNKFRCSRAAFGLKTARVVAVFRRMGPPFLCLQPSCRWNGKSCDWNVRSMCTPAHFRHLTQNCRPQRVALRSRMMDTVVETMTLRAREQLHEKAGCRSSSASLELIDLVCRYLRFNAGHSLLLCTRIDQQQHPLRVAAQHGAASRQANL